MTNKPFYLPIEETIDEYVSEFGGELVKKILTTPNFPNADYIFKKYEVVAELKTLEKDFFTEADYKKKLNELYDKWVKENLVPRFWGKLKIESRSLPHKCHLEISNIVKKPLENRVSKANKQIKETKKYFGVEDYKGVLILVNDGNYSLESETVMNLIGRIVNTQCKSIDSIIYFTVNMRADMPGLDKDILVWVDQHRNNAEGVSRNFLNDFRDGWLKFFQRKIGESIPAILLDDDSKLEEIKFIRDKVK